MNQARLEELQGLSQQLDRMLSAHLQEFAPSQRPLAPPIEPVDRRHARKARRKEQLRGLSLFAFADRRAARKRARQLADQDVQEETARREELRTGAQAELDAQWQKLQKNDPEAVLAALEASFEDNEAPAFAINCEDGRATVVVLMFPETDMPERYPALTPTGRPTAKKLTQTERSALYQAWMSSHLLATARETFAVAPALDAATLVALRAPRNPFGEIEVEALYCGTLSRERFERLDFGDPDVLDASFHADDLRIQTRGQAKRLVALDLTKEAELAELASQVKATLASQS